MSLLPSSLPFQLDRTVFIRATPAVVFRHFTDSARWAKWWGAGSTIDARAGGRVSIVHPGGVVSSGDVVEVNAPKRFVFTYGFDSGKPIPPGSSLVTITLAADPAGTKLHLHHALADEATSIEHAQGWRFQLSLFANVVADEVNTSSSDAVDGWFDAWAEPDVAKREMILTRIAAPEIQFNDRFSNLETIPDVMAHITAAQRFMPGIRLRRAGNVRHCQGMVLAEWTATGPDGAEAMRGTNAFVFGPTGRLESVTGFVTPKV